MRCLALAFGIRASSLSNASSRRWQPCKNTASFRITWLIPKADPQRAGRLHEVAVDRHGAPTANRLGDLDGNRVRRLQRNHVTIHLIGDELHGAGAESRAQQT